MRNKIIFMTVLIFGLSIGIINNVNRKTDSIDTIPMDTTSWKISKNIYQFEFTTLEKTFDPKTLIVQVPDFSRGLSFKTQGTPKKIRYTYRRLFKNGIQKSYRPLNEKLITEEIPSISYIGMKDINRNKDYATIRILAILGKDNPFRVEANNSIPTGLVRGTYEGVDVYYNDEKIIDYRGWNTYFKGIPDLEIFLLWGEIIGDEHFNKTELEAAYKKATTTGETYESDILEVGIQDGRLYLMFNHLFELFIDDSRLHREIYYNNTFAELYYPDPIILYEKYGALNE